MLGLILGVGSLAGGFVAQGGHLDILWQPWEFVIIGGIALGVFVMGNSFPTITDSAKGLLEAITNKVPKRKDYLSILSLLYALMRDLRGTGRAAVEEAIDAPHESELFKHFPSILSDKVLTTFICDYVRLIIIGNARSHEIEALMEQEIHTIRKHKIKAPSAMSTISEALPALGIVAAVLGIVKAMGALEESPEVLGHYIGAALIGTLTGIFASYAIVAPMAQLIKSTRERQMDPYILAKQTLIAFMNGALPQIALEHGRKTIAPGQRPTIDEVENEAISNTPAPVALKQAA